MVRRWSKRGDIQLWYWMYELLTILLLLMIMLVAVSGVINNTSFWKKYYAIDLALIADIENANNGDFTINYLIKDQKKFSFSGVTQKTFEITLTKDVIEVDEKRTDNKKIAPRTFPYAKHPDITVNDQSITSDIVVFSKIDNMLTLGAYSSVGEESCSPASTKKDLSKASFETLALDPDVNALAVATKAALDSFSDKSADRTKELTIIFDAQSTQVEDTATLSDDKNDKKRSMTVLYSDDITQEQSKKFACTLTKKVAAIYNADTNAAESIDVTYAKYRGELDQDSAFKEFYRKQDSETGQGSKIESEMEHIAPWIIIIGDKDVINQKLLEPIIITTKEYYEVK